MAYRQFRVEDTYAAPDLSVIDRTVANVGNILANAGRRKQAKRDEANQFKFDLDKGAYESDTKIFTEAATDITDRMKKSILNGNVQERNAVEREMVQRKGQQQQSVNQMTREKQIHQNIIDKAQRDKYYRADVGLEKLKFLHRPDITFENRGELMDKLENEIDGVETFKYDDYRADYVTKKKQQYKSIEFPLKSGGSKTVFDEAVFWNKKTGKPEVTEDHAIEYLESEPRIKEYFTDKVNKQIGQEIKSLKASGDSRTQWMKGLSDAEIMNELINDPSKNLINNKDYGVRVREDARLDLEKADRINSKVSYTGLTGDTNNSGGKWKNQNIVQEYTTNAFAQEARSGETGQSDLVTTFGSGGRISQRNGKPVQIETTNPTRTDIRRGITTHDNQGTAKINLTGYTLMPITSGKAPFVLKADTPEGRIEEIKNIPLDYFDPNGKIKLQPEMHIGLNAYTINDAGILNDIKNKKRDITSEMQVAKKSKNKEEEVRLEDLMENLEDVQQEIASGDYDVDDLILLANKAGIKKVQKEWIIPADKSDLAAIKNVTGGMDLNNPSEYYSSDMKAEAKAWADRAAEAKAKNFGAQSTVPAKKPVSLKPSYSANGQTYSLDDLKLMGYTDDQIKEAVRLGNLK